MDIKVYVKNGSGYTRYPIPPGTYQVELVRLNGCESERSGKSCRNQELHQITLNPIHPLLQYNSNVPVKTSIGVKKHIIEGPMTNLLYLALCCCASSNKNDAEALHEQQNSSRFEEMCPYLEEYIIDSCFAKEDSDYSALQVNNRHPSFYCIHIEELMHLEHSVQDAVLIIRNVPLIS